MGKTIDAFRSLPVCKDCGLGYRKRWSTGRGLCPACEFNVFISSFSEEQVDMIAGLNKQALVDALRAFPKVFDVGELRYGQSD